MIMETEPTNLFSLSLSSSSSLLKMNCSSDAAPIILREQHQGNMMSSPENTVAFGWGDFPVLNEEYTAGHTFTSCSPSSRFDTSSHMQQEWSSKPPSYVVASSSMRRRQYHFDDDDTPSTPSLALSLVSSSSSDDDDDDDIASNYSDESDIASSAFQQRKQQALVSQPVLKTSSKQQQQQPHVHFATVTVQEHEVVLGDHPWAGPYPLALGWQRYATHEYTLDDYEHERMSGRRRARCRGELPRRLSAVERCQRLLDLTEPSLASLQHLEKKRQHELENQTYPMHDDDDDDDESPLCFQDKMRQLPADFYTTIVSSPHGTTTRRKEYGTIHFF